ncbi:MAG: tRNA (cytidine(34)-2'-O)-methyltransferase [Acidimicrobiales bacterium]
MTDEPVFSEPVFSEPVLHVVLVAPEIAANTGNIIRLCANTGASLHLVDPLGFTLEDRRLRRAGLDYHELADVRRHADLDRCLAELDEAGSRLFALSGRGARRHDEVRWRSGDVAVFGAERAGLAASVLDRFPADRRVALPMRPGNRSLNLANAVAVVVYEAWRQHGFAGAATGGPAGGSLTETPGQPPYHPVGHEAGTEGRRG